MVAGLRIKKLYVFGGTPHVWNTTLPHNTIRQAAVIVKNMYPFVHLIFDFLLLGARLIAEKNSIILRTVWLKVVIQSPSFFTAVLSQKFGGTTI